MRHVIVIGGDSGLGSALARTHLHAGDRVGVTSRRDPRTLTSPLDLAQIPLGWKPPAGTEIAYLCAGITSIERCETQPDVTAQVNVQGTLELCRTLARAGVFIVFFSTNLVFDGEAAGVTIDAPLAPRCAYGRQKAAVEKALRDESLPALVIRLTKVIGPTHSLLNAWTKALQRSEPIAPFTDMTMAPVTLECATRASIAAAAPKVGGIVHVSASDDISYFDAAHHLARCLGAPAELVRRSTAREKLPSSRFVPRHTALAATKRSPVPFTPPDPLLAIEAHVREAAGASIPAAATCSHP